MEKQVGKRFIWVIKEFLSLKYQDICSDVFVIGSCQWKLVAYTMKNVDYLSLNLGVFDPSSLPCGWKRGVKFCIRVVNHTSEELSAVADSELWFDEKIPSRDFRAKLGLSKYHAKESGFLPKGDLMIVAELYALVVIAPSVVSVTSNNILLEKSQQQMVRMDVNGFSVLPSQVELVKCIFERQPDIASEVRTKNPHLRTTYINVLLGLIEMMCQSPEEISDDDMNEALVAVSCVVNAGFKLNWLEKKLHLVVEKRNRVQSGEARLPEMEGELLKLKKKCSDLKVLLEKERTEIAAAKIPLSFDDVVQCS